MDGTGASTPCATLNRRFCCLPASFSSLLPYRFCSHGWPHHQSRPICSPRFGAGPKPSSSARRGCRPSASAYAPVRASWTASRTSRRCLRNVGISMFGDSYKPSAVNRLPDRRRLRHRVRWSGRAGRARICRREPCAGASGQPPAHRPQRCGAPEQPGLRSRRRRQAPRADIAVLIYIKDRREAIAHLNPCA